MNEREDGTSLEMKIEPWPGGRWYRDLGNNAGHFWGHVQAIKPPTLLEITGPLFMSFPAVSNVQYRLTAEGNETRLQFRHSAMGQFPPELRANMDQGWGMLFTRIRQAAESKKPGRQAMSTVAANPKVVSREQWTAAHQEHLKKEKLLTRLRDDLSRERRQLPWVKVEKNYVFEGPNGKETLADLFGGRSQLVVYHFMFGPEWEQGCPSCSLIADHIDPSVVHLAQRDVSLVVVARAPWSRIEPFQKRMGWHFKWVSSYTNDFNRDYHVSFTPEEMANGSAYYNFSTAPFPAEEAPGISVFYKDENGDTFHTFSAYGRGGEPLLGVYSLLDLTPKGRNEEGLSFPMAWVRHHDRYPDAQMAGANGCCAHES